MRNHIHEIKQASSLTSSSYLMLSLLQLSYGDARLQFHVSSLRHSLVKGGDGMIWIKFYHPDGRDLGGYTLLGTFAGELQNTKEQLAAENGIKPEDIDTRVWNPKEVWGPSNGGLGMAKIFDMINAIYGKDFIRYE